MNKIISGILLASLIASSINAKMIRVDSKNIVYDTDTNLFWQDDSDSLGINKNWSDAINYCKSLKLAGYNDWKLPDTENNTLFDLLEKTYIFKNMSLESYWSSSESADKEDAWIVNFKSQSASKNNKNNIYNVKCIRFAKPGDSSSFEPEIKNAIQEEIQKKSDSERDAKAWGLTQKENSLVAYRNYLKQYPNGEYVKLANEFLAEKIKKLNEGAWNNASSQNTIPSYKAYLKQYPNGEYASSARSNIEELSPARIAQRKREAAERERQAEYDRKHQCDGFYPGKNFKVHTTGLFGGDERARVTGVDKDGGQISFEWYDGNSWRQEETTCSYLKTQMR